MEKTLLSFLYMFLLGLSLYAQEAVVRFEKIGLEQGLPQGQILDIIEDREGFIWFGVMNGLVKYDGYNFVQYTYQANDTTTLSYPTPHVLLEDHQGDIWVGTHSGLNRWNRKTNCFQRFFFDPKNRNSIPSNDIKALFEDNRGTLWIGTSHGLCWFEDGLFYRITTLIDNQLQIINTITEDHFGTIWAGSSHGLFKIDRYQRKGVLYPPFTDKTGPIEMVTINKAFTSRSGNIWIGGMNYFFVFDPGKETFTQVSLPAPIDQQGVLDIIQDKDEFLWLATLQDNGLFRYDIKNKVFQHFQYDPTNSFGLSSNRVISLAIDRLNHLWAGAYNGLNKLSLDKPRFTFLQQQPGQDHPINLIFRTHLDNWGGLWFSTYDRRFFYSDQPGKKARQFFLPSILKEQDLGDHSFCSVSEGEVWLMTLEDLSIHFSVNNGNIQMTALGDTLDGNGSQYIEEDLSNPDYLWLSSKQGLCRLHKGSLYKNFFPIDRSIPDVKNNFISHALQTPGDFIYVHFESNFNGRLARFNKHTGAYEEIDITPAMPDGKTTIHIRQFAYTPDGTVWMATAQGLGKVHPDTKAFSLITRVDGLIEDNLMGIATDRHGNVWIKSLQHVIKYSPVRDSFWHFNARLDMREFNTVGATVGKDGRIIFHGNNGFYSFLPDSVRLDTTLPRVVLTDFKILNRSQHFGTSPELINNVRLNHKENIFSFEFAALHFRNPQNNRYRYRLLNFNNEWVEAGMERKATYTSLNAGSYTFQVTASNADGIWNPETLSIDLSIAPAPWLTWWAKTFYLLFISGIIYAFYWFQLRRNLAKAEALRLRELDEIKTRLYTNITHEFRTPLTIISGMARKISRDPGGWLHEGLQMIQRNSQILLRLVNQMLDLAKLESGVFKINSIQAEAVGYLSYIVESFRAHGELKNIRLYFSTQQKEVLMDFDPDGLMKILSNLLSNAIKFTPKGGEVYVSVATQTGAYNPLPDNGMEFLKILEIRVKDTGVGIPSENLPYVFDRFYQVGDSSAVGTGGTGVGLALTRELVKLMGGQITVTSAEGKGSEFLLQLPITHKGLVKKIENWKMDTKKTAIVQFPGASSETPIKTFTSARVRSKKEDPTLLIVEDNPDIAKYLHSLLEENYQIETAADGREGIDKALELAPDLIISDVMMPGKDGFELCDTLKQDIRTSHIPIILITAKADQNYRIAGLKYGADAYLAKPFNEEELQVILYKMLELRQKLQIKYGAPTYLSAEPESSDTPLEDEFIRQVRRIVEEHLDDYALDVTKLCQALNITRTPLHNKLKALTGQSATEFIRSVRLEEARRRLLTTNQPISNIAFDTGFQNPSYFTKKFGEMFGASPTEYRGGTYDEKKKT